TGRHPLPEPTQLLQRLHEWGLNNHSEVVLYDDRPSAFAARAWWLLPWLGKREGVYLLGGGLSPWREASVDLPPFLSTQAPGTFPGRSAQPSRTTSTATAISSARSSYASASPRNWVNAQPVS